VVGSGAKILYNCSDEKARDWDLIVTDLNEWTQITTMLHESTLPVRLNSFGGLKVTSKRGEVDIWPQDLGSWLLRSLNKSMYHWRTNRYWVQSE